MPVLCTLLFQSCCTVHLSRGHVALETPSHIHCWQRINTIIQHKNRLLSLFFQEIIVITESKWMYEWLIPKTMRGKGSSPLSSWNQEQIHQMWPVFWGCITDNWHFVMIWQNRTIAFWVNSNQESWSICQKKAPCCDLLRPSMTSFALWNVIEVQTSLKTKSVSPCSFGHFSLLVCFDRLYTIESKWSRPVQTRGNSLAFHRAPAASQTLPLSSKTSQSLQDAFSHISIFLHSCSQEHGPWSYLIFSTTRSLITINSSKPSLISNSTAWYPSKLKFESHPLSMFCGNWLCFFFVNSCSQMNQPSYRHRWKHHRLGIGNYTCILKERHMYT